MQKKIIALAIAAAFSAPAFADVTVYGLVDVAVANIKGDGQQSDTQVLSGGLSTSRVGLKSAEDLGNGMKAIVNLEYKIDASTGTGLNQTARQQLLGLAGDFGTVAGGYLQTTAWDFANSYDPTSGSTVSPLGNATSGHFLINSVGLAARAQHALAYISPNMSGVTVAVNYSADLSNTSTGSQLGAASTATTGLDTKAMLASVNYAGGPVGAGLVYAKTSTNNAIDTHATEFALGGSYDFGVAKIFATYQSDTPTVAGVDQNSNKAESISATIPAGPGAVALSYAKAKMGNNKTTGATVPGATGETVAYLWTLSPTDTVYFAYTKESNDTGGNSFSVANNALAPATGNTLTAGGTSTEIAVGLRKKF